MRDNSVFDNVQIKKMTDGVIEQGCMMLAAENYINHANNFLFKTRSEGLDFQNSV